jgi:hypothetical protein
MSWELAGMLRAASDQAKGIAPPGLALQGQRVRSATFVLPADGPVRRGQRADLMVREGVPHASV